MDAMVMQDTRACAPNIIRPDPTQQVHINVPWVRIKSPLSNSYAFQNILKFEGALSSTSLQAAYPDVLCYLSLFLDARLTPQTPPVFTPPGSTQRVCVTAWTAWLLLSGPLWNSLIVCPPGLPRHIRFDVPAFYMSFRL